MPAMHRTGRSGALQVRDCWAVAMGNSYNDAERCVLAGYDNGDVKMFDLRTNTVRWEGNVRNGVCGVHFDRWAGQSAHGDLRSSSHLCTLLYRLCSSMSRQGQGRQARMWLVAVALPWLPVGGDVGTASRQIRILDEQCAQ